VDRLALGLLLAVLLAVPVGAVSLPLADTVVIRALNGTTLLDTATSFTANITEDSIVVVDTNTADGVRPAIDLSLTAQMSPIVLRSNTTLIIGDPLANTIVQANESVVWYDPATGEYRVWVPGSTYLSVQRIVVAPVNETQELAVGLSLYEALMTPLATSQTFSGTTSSLTDAKKFTVNIEAGAMVTLQMLSDSGKHDVYVFKPSNPSYQEVQQATGQPWTYYSAKSDWKIWYPATTVSFTAPETGEYLIVVVPYAQPGTFELGVQIAGVDTPGDATDVPAEDGADIGGVISGSSAAVAIIIIILVALAAWFVILPAMKK